MMLVQASDDVVVVRRLLCAAAVCEMPDLAYACLRYVVDRLTPDNCLLIWLCAADTEPLFECCPAARHPALELVDRCRAFAGKHFRHVVASRTFLALNAREVSPIDSLIHWRYVALVVVLWRPALSASSSSSSSSAASVTALR